MCDSLLASQSAQYTKSTFADISVFFLLKTLKDCGPNHLISKEQLGALTDCRCTPKGPEDKKTLRSLCVSSSCLSKYISKVLTYLLTIMKSWNSQSYQGQKSFLPHFLGLTISLKIGKTFPHLWKNVKELYTPSNTQQISPGYWILAYWCTLKSSKMQKCFGYSDTGNRHGRTLGVIPWYPAPGRCEAENDSFWRMQQGGPSPPTKVFAQAPAGYLLSLSAGSLEPGTTMHNWHIVLICFAF